MSIIPRVQLINIIPREMSRSRSSSEEVVKRRENRKRRESQKRRENQKRNLEEREENKLRFIYK